MTIYYYYWVCVDGKDEVELKEKQKRQTWTLIKTIEIRRMKRLKAKVKETLKIDEERTKTFTDLLTETSRKRYGSTSAWIFLTETIFFTKTAEIHHQGDPGPLEQPPSTYL